MIEKREREREQDKGEREREYYLQGEYDQVRSSFRGILALRRPLIMYTQRMFDMWSSVTSKLEAHANNLGQSNVQSPAGQNNSSGSIKGKATLQSKIPIYNNNHNI